MYASFHKMYQFLHYALNENERNAHTKYYLLNIALKNHCGIINRTNFYTRHKKNAEITW